MLEVGGESYAVTTRNNLISLSKIQNLIFPIYLSQLEPEEETPEVSSEIF